MRPPSSPPSAKGLPFDFDSTFPHGLHLVNSGGWEGEEKESPKRPTKAVPGWGSLGCAGSHQPSDAALSLSRNTSPRGAWKRLSVFLRDFQPQQSPGSHSALFHGTEAGSYHPLSLLTRGRSPLDMFKAPQDPTAPHSCLHPCLAALPQSGGEGHPSACATPTAVGIQPLEVLQEPLGWWKGSLLTAWGRMAES